MKSFFLCYLYVKFGECVQYLNILLTVTALLQPRNSVQCE